MSAAPGSGDGISASVSANERRLTLAGLAGAHEGGAPVRDRLTSMLFLAAVAHAILILGISFGVGASSHSSAPPGMEVLLVSDELPQAARNEHAAYLAQRTQLGSGNTRTQPLGSPPERAAATSAEEHRSGGPEATSGATEGEEKVLSTQAPAPLIRWQGQASRDSAARNPAASLAGLPQHGRGDARELVLRGDPKTGQWLSPDTRASRLAPYLDAWRRKVERVGTLNYPSAARRPDLSGSPIIEVAIAADGHLLEAAVLAPSGHPEIDQAAIQILHLASPFEPFPKALARDYGVLRFAYQWEFVAGQVGAGAVAVTGGTEGAHGP